MINKNQVITDQINILTLTQQEAFNEGDCNTIIDISQAILLLVDNLDKELIT